MSDAMTNREIEDVLTSIRRLVAQEGTRPSDNGRLILTEAQRVLDAAPSSEPSNDPEFASAVRGATDVPAHPTEPTAEPFLTEGTSIEVAASANQPDQPEAPILTGGASKAVKDEIDAVDIEAPKAQNRDLSLPEPDFGQLEATIAELEAAVSASGGSWEPEANIEFAPRPSNVTDLYGRLSFAHRNKKDVAASAEPGDLAAPVSETDSAPETPDQTDSLTAAESLQHDAVAGDLVGAVRNEAGEEPMQAPLDAGALAEPVFTHAQSETRWGEGSTPTGPDADADASGGVEMDLHDQGGDDAVAGKNAGSVRSERAEAERSHFDDAEAFDIDGEDAILDEDMLRTLVAQIVREELQGQLGGRVTQQVRKLVRSEISKALESRKYL